AGQHGGAPRLAELERGGSVLAHEDLLDGRHLGAVLADHLAKPVVDLFQAQGEGQLRHLDKAAIDEGQAVAGRFDEAVATQTGTRVDAQNEAHARTPWAGVTAPLPAARPAPR